MKKYRYSILTYNFDNYDILKNPLEIDPEAEYICVCNKNDYNNKELCNYNSKVWKIKYLKKEISPLYDTYYVRYHPFEFCSTDIIIILDASILIKKSLKNIINIFKEGNYCCGLMINFNFPRMMSDLRYWKFSRNLSDEDFKILRKFLIEENMLHYKGNLELGFHIYSPQSKDIYLKAWEFLLKISSIKKNKEIVRLDQIVMASVVQKYFSERKYLFLCRNLFQSDYLQIFFHKSNKKFIKKMNLIKVYFFNELICLKDIFGFGIK